MTATLVVDAQGRMVLSIPAPVSPAMKAAIQASFDAWRNAQPPELLIVPESEVVRVVAVELEVPA